MVAQSPTFNGSAAQANKRLQRATASGCSALRGSKPVDLSEECPDSEWQTVHTYRYQWLLKLQ